MVILKELEIQNCFSQKHVNLHFEANNYATIFNSSASQKINLIYAVQSFFCKDKALFQMGCMPDCQPGSSLIRIKFIICGAESGRNIIVDAMRLFSKPDVVLYYFDDIQYIDLIHVFHERCQLDTFQRRTHNESFIELLTNYLSISNDRQILNHERIAKYMRISLLIDRERELLKKQTFVDIVNEIGYIFRYITWEEFSVKVIIPLSEKTENLQDMNWNYMDLNKTETWVKKEGSTIYCIWSELEPGLREIMKISQMIAVAKHLQKKCIFIENTNVLQKYQNLESIKEAIAETINTDSEANLRKKNFLWRIVDICSRLKLTVFINYYGRLPLLPSNANIIQCTNRDSNTDEPMYVHVE